jgi:hypothetical protein
MGTSNKEGLPSENEISKWDPAQMKERCCFAKWLRYINFLPKYGK